MRSIRRRGYCSRSSEDPGQAKVNCEKYGQRIMQLYTQIGGTVNDVLIARIVKRGSANCGR